MLVMTEAAAEVVKSVTSGPDAPAGAGLRIVSASQGPNQPGLLKVSAVEGPAEDDQIIEGNGALVFLESEAAVVLNDKVLDARVDEQGQPYFTVGEQTPGHSG
ncbi:MAG: Fe-S cluster assembly protein HesB [Streptosporangiaceae bacterium]|nr:Fe-S cluster assembly protein HesB [Streptosporangiaceae bacterium]MBV9854257.1 Fe-S cluster assembly protein HesB [Streptosporangiaceae bacterium]